MYIFVDKIKFGWQQFTNVTVLDGYFRCNSYNFTLMTVQITFGEYKIS